MSGDIHLLPACQKCKLRKVKCDRQAPKCAHCTKGNVACIIVDPVTGEQYARDYIRQLEEQEKELRAKVGERASEDEEAIARDAATIRSEATEPSPRGPPTGPRTGPLTGGSAASPNGFVGDGSGLGFLCSILAEAKWQRHRTRILDQLATRPRIEKLHLTANPLPPLQEAEHLLENYFERFHIHHTFLLRQEVLSIFNRVYDAAIVSSDQDRFRLLMVFAISATTRYRAGISNEHPYGYFMAAEKYLGRYRRHPESPPCRPIWHVPPHRHIIMGNIPALYAPMHRVAAPVTTDAIPRSFDRATSSTHLLGVLCP
jgi:hypothetical protein